ncbi:MAG: HAD family hydrolase [Candidatus Helarchaeota archaeon]
MKFQAIIFDFDGTIADTRMNIVNTFKETLESLGYYSFDAKRVKKLIGLPLKTTFIKVAGLEGEKLDRAILEYRFRFLKNAYDSIFLFLNVEKTLKILYNKGLKLSIASNRGNDILNKLLIKFGIHNLFLHTVGEQDAKNKKPAPESITLILEKLKITPDKIIMIGDTIYDILMGKKANCYTCAVTYGNNSKKELETVSPDFIIDDFSQILDII